MPLPPTTNSLPASQRTRLLKSTRKLTDVLGATPHVLDTDIFFSLPSTSKTTTTTTPVRQKRQGIQLYSSPHAASSSFISLPDSDESAPDYYPPSYHPTLHRQQSERSGMLKHRHRQKNSIDRPLVLRLHPLNSLSAVDSDSASPASYAIRLSLTAIPSSPLSPILSATLPSVPSPTASDEDGMVEEGGSYSASNANNAESKIRRKRMVKLTRTLGGNVPSELLLSQCSRARSPCDDQQGRNVRAKIAAAVDDSALDARPSTADGAVTATATATAATAAMPKERRRAVSSASNRPPFPARTTSLPTRSASTKVHKTQRDEDHHHHHRRAESEWNGEWSIEDAEKRARALRNLRCR